MNKWGITNKGKKLHLFDIDTEDGSSICLCNDKIYDEYGYSTYLDNDVFLHNSNYCKRCNKLEVKE